MRIVSLDLSFNSSGCFFYDTEKNIYDYMTFSTKKKDRHNNKIVYFNKGMFNSRFEQYDFHQEHILKFIKQKDPDIIVLENYAFGATRSNDTVFGFGEKVRSSIYYLGIKMYEYSPSSIKKSFCGNGRAKKIDMIKKYNTIHHDDNILNEIKNKSLSNNGNVVKPYEDVIDSYAILKHHLKMEKI